MNSAPNTGEEVVIMVSEAFEPVLAEQAHSHHVWAVRTPEAERIARAIWADQSPGESTNATGITLFAATGDPETDLLSIIDTVELHHGLAAGKPPANVFRVLGVQLTDAIRDTLCSVGFSRLVSTQEGFTATWDDS